MRHDNATERLLKHLEGKGPFWVALTRGHKGRVQQAIAYVLDALVLALEDLGEGESLALRDFGKFRWVRQNPRQHYNLDTKRMEKVPAKLTLKFEPAKRLRRALNGEDSGGDPERGTDEPSVQNEDGILLC